MRLSQMAGVLAITAAATTGCRENPASLNCNEIKAEITSLNKPDELPAATFEGAVVREASRNTRIQALEAAASDKGCSK